MAHQKIYVVDDYEEQPPRAVFDSIEKAQQYIHRFKMNKKYLIFEQDLNPDFTIDPERTPTEVSFEPNGDIHISRIDDGDYIELAEENDYEPDSGILRCFTLAKDESEALINAMKIRDKAIEEGDWEMD